MVPSPRNRRETHGVIAGLVPAISIRLARRQIVGTTGTSPAMAKRAHHRVCSYCVVACSTFQLHEKLLT
jgi:hypothetical protein